MVHMRHLKLLFCLFGAGLVWSGIFFDAHASDLVFISDTLSNSRPATSSNHTILFSTTNAVPPSGKISIFPQGGVFNIPAGLDYTDIDFATSSSLTGPFGERFLLASPSAAADGVSVVPGANGSITITLNSTTGLAASSTVKISVGTNAATSTVGDTQIVNPGGTGTFYVTVQTKNTSDNVIDWQEPRVAISEPVSVHSLRVDVVPPVRSNGLPSGNLLYSTQQVEIALTTDELATCRYSTSNGISYDSMTNSFSESRVTLHTVNIGAVVSGTTYIFYARCQDLFTNTNTDDFIISFAITTPPGPSGPSGAPSSGGGGAAFPPLPSSPEVMFSGWAYPSASVVVLKDGKQAKSISADTGAKFSASLTDLEQGSYTFGVFARDTDGRKSNTSSYSEVLVGGTKTNISNILIPPSLEVVKDTVSPGEDLSVLGQSVPDSIIRVWAYAQSENSPRDSSPKAVIKEEKADSSGRWTAAIPTGSFAVDTYIVRAKFKNTPIGTSEYSNPVYFGVGKSPSPDFCKRSDINKDGKVQLTDFSILLFNWGTDSTESDINIDGRVNLTDFSIMLFCWTG
ncbi:MAG: hypothetical protein A3D57_03265 [Candidatus Sungbacteria bacterium RIFCSPHIGHO2_02_FULL_46_12]|nr:MAG: hypothetical protein A3D57_03265 [Candidatus Sungbacteria bacterium RIFCSPHIGHO2_02_FULL_46_12]